MKQEYLMQLLITINLIVFTYATVLYLLCKCITTLRNFIYILWSIDNKDDEAALKKFTKILYRPLVFCIILSVIILVAHTIYSVL